MSAQLLGQLVLALADLADACNTAMAADLGDGPAFRELRDSSQRFVVVYGALELAMSPTEELRTQAVEQYHSSNLLGLTKPMTAGVSPGSSN